VAPAGDHVERIRAQFTRQAEVYAGLRQTRDEASLRGLVALAGTGPSDRVLDVACGPGFLTLAFAERCGSALGVDATAALLELARREAAARGLERVDFVAGDATRLELPDASFDVVACRAAFHHFPEPGRVLAEMGRVAVPGGRLLVADLLGSEDPRQAAMHDRIETLCDPTHVRAIPLSGFEALFRDAGLELVRRALGTLSYDVEEWISHGGPDAASAGRIRELLRASLDGNACGLDVRVEEGRLRFSHRTAAFLLRVSRGG
jgi:ubiquinone/menaquinone biosynthesis C-methylase UbiE